MADDSKSVFERAIKEFGTTNNLKETFWVLPDGTLLDGSGKKHGGSKGMRAHDHREICRVFTTKKAMSGNEAMVSFGNFGAFRYLPESGAIDLRLPPTTKQKNIITQIVRMNETVFFVELFSKQFGTMYFEYPPRTTPKKIIQDIDKFYVDGTQSKLSLSQMFHENRIEQEKENMFVSIFKEFLLEAVKLPQNLGQKIARAGFDGVKVFKGEGDSFAAISKILATAGFGVDQKAWSDLINSPWSDVVPNQKSETLQLNGLNEYGKKVGKLKDTTLDLIINQIGRNQVTIDVSVNLSKLKTDSEDE